MADSLHILLLEDSPFDAELVELELLQSGIVSDCSRVTSCAAFCAEPLDDYDVILADYTLPDGTAADALEVVQRRGLDTPFIVITGTIGEERAVELIKLGVTDYLLKDRLERLGTAISRALDEQRVHRAKMAAEKSLRQALVDARENRDRLDRVLQLMADGLLLTDLDGNVLHMNVAAEHLLQQPLAGCKGAGVADLTGGLLLGSHLESMVRGTPGTEFVEWDQPGGEPPGIRVQAHSAISLNGTGGSGEVITVLRDITASYRMNQIRKEFVSSAAHELQTPLTAIICCGELLMQHAGYLPVELREALDIVTDKAWTLSTIVDNILLSYVLEQGRKLEFAPRTIDLSDKIRKITGEHRQQLGSCTLVLDLPDQPMSCHLDPLRIEQVLVNLLSNAVKFSPGGGEVRVACHKDAHGLLLSVVDHGMGMTREQSVRAFEPFYRAHAPGSGAGGCGLGLSLVKQIVEALDGEVQIVSQPGMGTTVTVRLPLETPTQS